MNVKKLNKLSKEENTINTGYRIYIGCKEKWTKGVYNGRETNLFVSSLGRVYDNDRKRFLKLHENGSKYLYCQYYFTREKRTTILINRLVLESFNGRSDIIDAQADHKNRNIHDNKLENLQWLSPSENLQKRVYNQSGENNNYSKYKEKDIILIADMLASGNYSCKQIASMLNIPLSSVNNIKMKIRWKYLLENYDFSKVRPNYSTQ